MNLRDKLTKFSFNGSGRPDDAAYSTPLHPRPLGRRGSDCKLSLFFQDRKTLLFLKIANQVKHLIVTIHKNLCAAANLELFLFSLCGFGCKSFFFYSKPLCFFSLTLQFFLFQSLFFFLFFKQPGLSFRCFFSSNFSRFSLHSLFLNLRGKYELLVLTDLAYQQSLSIGY